MGLKRFDSEGLKSLTSKILSSTRQAKALTIEQLLKAKKDANPEMICNFLNIKIFKKNELVSRPLVRLIQTLWFQQPRSFEDFHHMGHLKWLISETN